MQYLKQEKLNMVPISSMDETFASFGEGSVFNADVIKSDILLEFAKDYRQQAGIQTMFWNKFNKMLGGQRPGELIIILADTGIGKTTFAMNWCADTIQQGHNALYISLENSALNVGKQIALMLSGIYVDQPATKSQIQTISQNIDQYFDNLLFYDPESHPNELNLIKAILWSKKNKNCSTVILDHFDAISINRENGDSLTNSQTRFLNFFRRFLGHFGITCIGIVHPAKSGDKGGYNQTKNRGDRQIMIDEIKGSSSFKQVADIVLSLSRPSDLGGNITSVRLEKIRAQGFGKLGDEVLMKIGPGYKFEEYFEGF